nr:hypothetical protein GCM10020185_50310 [Pseudomonas brassicacearum subsp. brassicacearum]
MLDNAGRKFSATRINPSSNSQGRRTNGWCCWACSSSASASINSSSSSAARLGAVEVAGSSRSRDMEKLGFGAQGFKHSGFIDQLAAQGLGPLRILLLDGFKDFDMQVEHMLMARG